AAFSGLPVITGANYAPLQGVPAADIIYTAQAPIHPGPSAVLAPDFCLFMSTDVSPFWLGVATLAQAHGLAAAYLNFAGSLCPRVNTPPTACPITINGVPHSDGSVVSAAVGSALSIQCQVTDPGCDVVQYVVDPCPPFVAGATSGTFTDLPGQISLSGRPRV